MKSIPLHHQTQILRVSLKPLFCYKSWINASIFESPCNITSRQIYRDIQNKFIEKFSFIDVNHIPSFNILAKNRPKIISYSLPDLVTQETWKNAWFIKKNNVSHTQTNFTDLIMPQSKKSIKPHTSKLERYFINHITKLFKRQKTIANDITKHILTYTMMWIHLLFHPLVVLYITK